MAGTIDGVFIQYIRLMEEIKQRSNLILQLVNDQIPLSEIARFELCQLQIRSISEVMALACLTAHGDIQDVRSASLQSEYNAEKIFKRLERLHPDYFPNPNQRIPVTATAGSPAHYEIRPITEPFLTKAEIIHSYNECGRYLHRGSLRRLITEWYPKIDFTKIRLWNENLGRLLSPYHFISLHGHRQMLLCVMNDTNQGGRVQCALAERMEPTPAFN